MIKKIKSKLGQYEMARNAKKKFDRGKNILKSKININVLKKKLVRIKNKEIVLFDTNPEYQELFKGKKLSTIKSDIRKKEKIYIGLTKLNFFRLEEIISFVGKEIKIRNFKIKKPDSIFNDFMAYMTQTNRILKKNNVELIFTSKELIDLFLEVQIQSHSVNNELLSALGVVCHTAFIGPKRLLIDLTDHCNLDCIYCRGHSPLQIGSHKMLNSSKEMDFEKLKRILDDAKDLHVEEILLVGGGEPTVYKEFIEVLKEIKKRGLRMHFSTNGLLINKKLAEALVKFDGVQIQVSISAANQKTYKKLHPSQNEKRFTILKENLKHLSYLKKKHKMNKITLSALNVVNKYNFDEILEMVDFAKEIDFDEIHYQLLHVEDFSKFMRLDKKQKSLLRKKINEARSRARRKNLKFTDYINFQLDNLKDDGTWSKDCWGNNGCLVGWNFSFIKPDLEVFLCCGMRLIDVIGEKSYKEIWFSNRYNRYREVAKKFDLKHNLKSMNHKYIIDDYCNYCDNHNFNVEIFNMIKKYNLERFLIK